MIDKKLHVLFICGWYPSRVLPTNGDFIERHAQTVAIQHKVSVIHLITDKNCTEKIEIITKEEKNITTHIGYIQPQKNTLSKLKCFWKAYQQILNKIGFFDVIHLNEIHPFGLLAKHTSKKYNKPYIVSEHHTAYLKSANNNLSYFKKIIAKNVVKNAAFICPVSDFLENHLKDSGFEGTYKTVPNVVDTSLFFPRKKEDGILKIVHVSSLKDAHKNIKGMLRVAKLLEEELSYFEWHFIGNNGHQYKEFIHNLNFKKAKIHFINHVSQKELVNYLQKATLCISFSNYE
ncbi:glycosyltransferase family 4 protein, partial [Polaribacter sp.]|uniref:glycosyltransferase family 4 protein n=1 Tax=Polaribacter sp. TaxID=1920175 RepID=UPI003F6BBE3D